jgi:hypothetical protein
MGFLVLTRRTVMNKFYILLILILVFGVFSAGAQDMIVLTNGNMIEAKVEEISPTEIRYRRFDNLNGPIIIINKNDVLSIRYENGVVEVINSVSAPAPATAPASGQQAQASKPAGPVLNPNKLYFSLSLEPSGFLAGGPSATGEFTKGGFNTLFHVSFPTLTLNSISSGFGMGVGAGVNYFWSGRIGGFYLGGLFEWNAYPYLDTVFNPYHTYNPSTD